MKVLIEKDSDGVYHVEVSSLKEGVLAQIDNSVAEFKKSRKIYMPPAEYKAVLKVFMKLAGCSRRKARKVCALVYGCKRAYETLLKRNPSLDSQELLGVIYEALGEKLTKLRLSPTQITNVRAFLEELLERDLQELKWDDLPP